MIGIIHCLYLAQNPTHMPFEKFSYLYMALDACFKATSEMHSPPKNLSHAERIEWTCQQFEIPVPKWAAAQSGKPTEILGVRNHTIHEALFFDEPLGFVNYGGSPCSAGLNTPLQMEALVCRFIVALLGMPQAD